MAFDLGPAARVAPKCTYCPVQKCPGNAGRVAAVWREMVELMVPQTPGMSRLMTAGEPLNALFVVRAGCIKSYIIDASGHEHIRGFHFPGDLVGLEALGSPLAIASAEPVTLSQVCAISTHDLTRRLATDTALSMLLLTRSQRDLRQVLALLGEGTADQRVAAFLLDVHARIGSGDVLRLPMSRRDVGQYLRLATETVCRVFTRLERRGLLLSRDKRITLRDIGALREMAEPVGLSPAAAELEAA